MAKQVEIYVVEGERKIGPFTNMDDADKCVEYCCQSRGGEGKDYPIVSNELQYRIACHNYRVNLARSKKAMAAG